MTAETINKLTEALQLAKADMEMNIAKLPEPMRSDLRKRIALAMESKDSSDLLKFAEELKQQAANTQPK